MWLIRLTYLPYCVEFTGMFGVFRLVTASELAEATYCIVSVDNMSAG